MSLNHGHSAVRFQLTHKPAAPRQRFRFPCPLSPVAAALVFVLGVYPHSDIHAQVQGAWFAQGNSQQFQQHSQAARQHAARAAHQGPDTAQQQTAARAQLAQSLDNLNRTAHAIAAQQAAQNAARLAAQQQASDVADGLAQGGLEVASGDKAKWLGAEAAVQTVQNGQHHVSIKQTEAKAILNWNRFDVGRNTTVEFQQKSSDAVLNRVVGADTAPSQIQGVIKGDGTVMVVNQNGVVFSGTSQVNVRNLVAAAAHITDTQFLDDKLGLYGADSQSPTFTDAKGALLVQPGAQIRTHRPDSVTQGGGYVLLLGTQVHNAGQIHTPKGQTLLAAGDSFVIRKGLVSDNAQGGATYSTTRGNEVAARRHAQGSAPGDDGTVTNSGLIQAQEGDVTLTGHQVHQQGVAFATTTVIQRGTVHLLNSSTDATGRIRLGQDAITAVLLQDEGHTALDSQRDKLIADSGEQDALRGKQSPTDRGAFDHLSLLPDRRDQSRIELVSGGDIYFAPGSLTLATGGQIVADSKGRSLVSQQAQLDVAGAVGVQVAMASNTVKINVQGFELRDSPLNRDTGKLFNREVWVDRRNLVSLPSGTGAYAGERWYTANGLLEVGGYLSHQGHTVGEWAAQGGTITLAGSQVVTQAGSQVNLAGGSLNVQTGHVRQSWLKGQDGRIYNLSSAPPEIAFDGIYRGYESTHARWGEKASRLFYSPLLAPSQRLETGYTVGRDAGRLIISTSTAVLEGQVQAQVYQGQRQSKARDAGVKDGYYQSQTAVARAGALAVRGAYQADLAYWQAADAKIQLGPIEGVTGALALDQVDMALPEQRVGTVWLDAQQVSSWQLGELEANSLQSILVDAPLSLAPGGQLQLRAKHIDIHANVSARGGRIQLGQPTDADERLRTERITLAPGVVLDTRGLWHEQPEPWQQAYIDGGEVSLRAQGDVLLSEGSLIDASAGGYLNNKGAVVGGKGGDISLIASLATGIPGEVSTTPLNQGELRLDGALRSYGFSQGGRLSLQTGGVLSIGAALDGQGGTLAAGVSSPYQLVLSRDTKIPEGSVLPFEQDFKLTILPPGFALKDWNTYFQTYGQAAEWSGKGGIRDFQDFNGNGDKDEFLVTQAPWTNIPGAMQIIDASGTTKTIPKGGLIPEGSRIITLAMDYNDLVNKGLQFPKGVFPQGVPLDLDSGRNHLPYHLPAGQTTEFELTLKKDTVLLPGTVLMVDMPVKPVVATALDPSFFQRGFSAYSVNAQSGLAVTEGTRLNAFMPVYRSRLAAQGAPAGLAFDERVELWTPPLYLEDAQRRRLTQRKGVDVELFSGPELHNNYSSNQLGFLRIESDAHISLDPDATLRLSSTGQITVDGQLQAPSGRIVIANTYDSNMPVDPQGLSIWIGSQAVLNVAAQAYRAQDQVGRSYGVVPGGGQILLGSEAGQDPNNTGKERSSHAHVIVRPGARLDASGTIGILDVLGQDGVRKPTQVASSGGVIALRSQSGIYIDGDMQARAGGVGALGGTLDVRLETAVFHGVNPYFNPLPPLLDIGRVLFVRQHGGSQLGQDLQAGQMDEALLLGRGAVGVDQIEHGGFDSVSLLGRHALVFEGGVALSLGRSLTLKAGQYAALGGDVALSAPYVLLQGQNSIRTKPYYDELPTKVPLYEVQRALHVSSNLLELQGPVATTFASTRLESTGDMRILPGFLNLDTGKPSIQSGVYAAGDLHLQAQRIYPASGVVGSIMAGYTTTPSRNEAPAYGAPSYGPVSELRFRKTEPWAVLSVSRAAQEPVLAPYSAFGSLVLEAGSIQQGGALYAPFGSIVMKAGSDDERGDWSVSGPLQDAASAVDFLAGSITSVSGAGLVMPYGGTRDGVSYEVDGQQVLALHLLTGQALQADGTPVQDGLAVGISIQATHVTSQEGAVIDLSGGGQLLGAAFLSGRGGSVDTLQYPLFASNPVNRYSAPGNQVYAILPGVDVAPVPGGYASAWEGARPQAGQQITLNTGVPGLPAGTYTLLPAQYALLPGAYRIELGQTSGMGSLTTQALSNGSYLAAGQQSLAYTGQHDALSTAVVVTPGTVLRSYSQYKETSYADFQLARAAMHSTVRPLLEVDAKSLSLIFRAMHATAPSTDRPVLEWAQDSARLLPAEGGYAGYVAIGTSSSPDAWTTTLRLVAADGAAPAQSPEDILLNASTINNIQASTLYIGGPPVLRHEGQNNQISFGVAGGIPADTTIEQGAVLRGAQVFVMGSTNYQSQITLEAGALIDTRAASDVPLIDSSLGFVFGSSGALLVASNGAIELRPYSNKWSTHTIEIGQGAALYARGTVGFAVQNGVTFLGEPLLGAPRLLLASSAINLGADAAALAKAPAGINLTTAQLAALLAGNPAQNISGAKTLALTALDSVNIFGSMEFGFNDQAPLLSELVLKTPALYGSGTASDVARLRLGSLVWDQESVDGNPGHTTLGAILDGTGQLEIHAEQIRWSDTGMTLYKPFSDDRNVSVDRLVQGFSHLTLHATKLISSHGAGSLSVYQSGQEGVVFDPNTYAGQGGALTLMTPLLTGDSGSVMSYRSGGHLLVQAAQGQAALPAQQEGLGARIELIAGGDLALDSWVALAGGQLKGQAVGNIMLGQNSYLDLGGRGIQFFDVTRFTPGGELILESSKGHIRQAVGGLIDVSAQQQHAGYITLTATNEQAGQVQLLGRLLGHAADGFSGGHMDVRAQTIGAGAQSVSTDFAALNTQLNDGGFFGSRAFVLKQGNLVIGNELRAHQVQVSVDGGSLQVQGYINAFGAMPGIIRLAARDDLILNSGAVLDVSASVLHTDSYGQAIHAKNRGHIELSSRDGWLRLNPGATLNLLSADGVVRGQVELNAGRTQPSSGELRVQASGPLHIHGAQDIFINAVQAYELTDGAQIDQALLDGYDQDSLAFMQAAYGSSGTVKAFLQESLAGLLAYGPALHLRPGLELRSSGDLYTVGDIDLSRYRYGPEADRLSSSARYGAGEALSLVVRAGGNLNIQGSVSDGFKAFPGVAPTYKLVSDVGMDNTNYFRYNTDNWWEPPHYQVAEQTRFVVGPEGWEVPFLTNGYPLDWGVMPMDQADLYSSTQFWGSGDIIPPGTVFYLMQIPAEISSAYLALTLEADPGTPSYAATDAPALMLASGLHSSSLRLVAGADTNAALTRVVQPFSQVVSTGHLLLGAPGDASPIGSEQTSQIPIGRVLRTGTGNLELLAGGHIEQRTVYGIYTAGTQVDAGDVRLPAHSYLTDQGGDLFLQAQGDITGYSYVPHAATGTDAYWASNSWLLRQGSETENATWSIRFGHGTATDWYRQGFSGMGTLGGGNLTLLAGGNAGTIEGKDKLIENDAGSYGALNLAIGGTGWVTSVSRSGAIVTGGTLLQAGGGDMHVRVGGQLNAFDSSDHSNQMKNGTASLFTAIRGNIHIAAGSIGSIDRRYGLRQEADPRVSESLAAAKAQAYGGVVLGPGDGAVFVHALKDLVVGTVFDPGQIAAEKGSTTYFSLWKPDSTSLDLLALGGDLVPLTGGGLWSAKNSLGIQAWQDSKTMFPARVRMLASRGHVYLSTSVPAADSTLDKSPILHVLELASSSVGQLEILARGSIYGSAQLNNTSSFDSLRLNVSAAPNGVNDIPNPFRPAIARRKLDYHDFYQFQAGTASLLHLGNTSPIRLYALEGDVLNVLLGQTIYSDFIYPDQKRYIAAQPAHIRAGRDIVNFGWGTARLTESQEKTKTPTQVKQYRDGWASLIMNVNDTDVSVIQAGRDILYPNVDVAGPGTLEMSAGRMLYFGHQGHITSLGSVVAGDTRPGASIVLTAGAGTAGPDYALMAARYLNPANQADIGAGVTLVEQGGKVAHTYEQELLQWLAERFGYQAVDTADALAYFAALAPEQQRVFLRAVYYTELKLGGREFTDVGGPRQGSYLRGRQAIATLFPAQDAQGQAVQRGGDYTAFGAAGVQTLFGGDIQALVPAGQIVVGTEGSIPPASSGFITQGAGDISLYSNGSILLGLSRIMTTFGGDILAWSATGDINAGRGSKTTLVYTPPKRLYDAWGNVSISPDVPSTGAGIATLAPIPEVPSGDIDLIAPLGTIDAGEAGIRVSGNVNIAALHVVNAENIQVQGESKGMPVVAAVNVGALTSASSAASSAATAAQETLARARSEARSSQPSQIQVQVLGFGNEQSTAPVPVSSAPVWQADQHQYDDRHAVRVLSFGAPDTQRQNLLTSTERRNLGL